VIVGEDCIVRAEFHQAGRHYPYEIVITPKMSFGTGHHATTWLMLHAQLGIDHTDKAVMDAGCGTAILSIMASMRGARTVEAFDIDEWSTVNGIENLENNGCANVSLRQGTIRTLKFAESFDLILANIKVDVVYSFFFAVKNMNLPTVDSGVLMSELTDGPCMVPVVNGFHGSTSRGLGVG